MKSSNLPQSCNLEPIFVSQVGPSTLAVTDYTVKIAIIADGKLTKSLGNYENKQPNCAMKFIFVFILAFIYYVLSKVEGFDQLWTAF